MFIENIKKAHKLWSVKLGALSVFFSAFCLAILEGWALVPDVVKNNLPPEIVQKVAVSVAILTVVARLIKQP